MLYAGHLLGGTPLQRCSQCILQPQPSGQYICTDWIKTDSFIKRFITNNSIKQCHMYHSLFYKGCRRNSFYSPLVTMTLLSILAVFNNAVVWMVSTRSPTSKSSMPFNNPLVTVPKAPITIGIIVTFMFHSFFNSLVGSRYLSLFSHSFNFILWSARTAKSTILQILFFCCWLLWDLVFGSRLGDPFVYQSPTGVCVHHFLGQVLGCAYTICWHGQI